MKITELFDFFSARQKIRRASLVVLSLILAALLATLHFSEDISDFLPLGTTEREQMSIYQNIAGADKLFILFSNPGDADHTVEAIDAFVDLATEGDPSNWCERLTGQVDMETIGQVTDFVYANMPYFLTEAEKEAIVAYLLYPKVKKN